MDELRIEHVSKLFPPTFHALDDISLTVQPGETLALVGPSGCGKTTLLRLIAGLEPPTAGHIYLGAALLNHVPCHQRQVAMLFQRPALLAQQTVRQNLSWGWSLRRSWTERWFRRENSEYTNRLIGVAQKLGLEQELDRRISQLSGGQQQRVALGRCLLRAPKIWLLDEPLGHLDAPLRADVRRQIRSLAQQNAIALLFVTHDPGEALAIGDRVAVMQQGRIVQLDEPNELRRQPHHRFVVDLLHHDRGGVNYLEGSLRKNEGNLCFEGPCGRWVIHPNFLRDTKNFLTKDDTIHIIIAIAAEQVECSTDLSPRDGMISLPVHIVQHEFSTEATWIVARDAQGRSWMGRADPTQRLPMGQALTMTFSSRQLYGFDAVTGMTLWTPTG